MSVTLAEVRTWPPTVDVRQAALALGVGKSAAYEWIRTGTFPAPVISNGRSYRVVTAGLIELLSQTGCQTINVRRDGVNGGGHAA